MQSGSLKVSKPLISNVVARQDAPTVYEHVASTYVISPNYLKVAESLFEGNVIPYMMPFERSLDIDSQFDFKIIEFLMKEKIG